MLLLGERKDYNDLYLSNLPYPLIGITLLSAFIFPIQEWPLMALIDNLIFGSNTNI